MMETKIKTDISLIAYCGLYCASCRSNLNAKCPGCAKNEKATWCKVRACCMKNSYKCCADCQTYPDPMECKMFNNFISKLFAILFRSDRQACILMIKEKGYEGFATFMSENKLQTIQRK
jgi:hypothetical protein